MGGGGAHVHDSEFTQQLESGAPNLTPLAELTVLKGLGTAVETAGSGLLRIFGLTVGAVFMPHGGYNPEAGSRQNFNIDRDFAEFLEQSKNYVTVYRGVGENVHSTEYELAKKGIAVPKAYVPSYTPGNPHSDPNTHTYGDNYSFFTSWTTNESFAKFAALKNSNSGVIMTMSIHKSEIIMSPASALPPFDLEQEVQLFGVRQAITVTPVNK